MLGDDSFPKLVCEECTGELVMVAKFREKCAMSTAALGQLTKQIHRSSTTILKLISPQMETIEEDPKTNDDSIRSDTIEPIEYDDDNVEYVIIDSGQDFGEGNEIINETIEKEQVNIQH